MTPGKTNALGAFVERHRRVHEALAEAGFGTVRSGPVLETGHHLGVYCTGPNGEWFARIHDLSGGWQDNAHVMWLGTDDEAVPERLRQELAKPEAVAYLRATMR